MFFFFNETATPEIYTLSLHDPLPIFRRGCAASSARTSIDTTAAWSASRSSTRTSRRGSRDRKSTRLNSSHSQISYAVFCLKKKTTSHRHSYHNVRVRANYHVVASQTR